MKGLKESSTWKEFLMTLLATTVSIVLTFGTTAIVDRKKQRAEKREMVLMVMYDMRESLLDCERSQEGLRAFCDVQVDLVAHPEKFVSDPVLLLAQFPILTYTTTTESIFRSNIETIRTIGNILFVETVSAFYDERNKYKTDVVEKFQEEEEMATSRYENLAALDAPSYVYFGEMYYQAMKRDFEECKMLMNVSEDDLDVFRKEQERLEQSLLGESRAEMVGRVNEERNQLEKALLKARKEGRKALEQD